MIPGGPKSVYLIPDNTVSISFLMSSYVVVVGERLIPLVLNLADFIYFISFSETF